MHASSMPGHRDANGGGRTSRASNMSARSTASGQQRQGAGKPDLLSAAAPGVMSMLRTSTEMGSVAGLTGSDVSGIGSLPRAPQRWGATSRLSTTSSHSNQSGRASRHHRQWPSQSSTARRSITREPIGPQFVADSLSPTIMSIPGSSPLVPRMRDRDSHRSMSMTHASQPAFRLASNRSLGSLRHEHIQRPKSPYVYPTRLRRPSYRSNSPALSDISGSYPRRAQGYGGPSGSSHYPQQHMSGPSGPYPGQQRPRMPSDASLGQQDRMHYPPHRPSRGPSPVYYPGPRQDVPPMPVGYQHQIAMEQARMLNRSAKGSLSSSSTNVRTDSDPPSSDMASPPTPKDGAVVEVMLGPEGTQFSANGVHRIENGQYYSRPMYYDGSEQFERDQVAEPKTNLVPPGYVTRYTTILEERPLSEITSKTHAPPQTKVSVEITRSEAPAMAELPASPVPRRINRGHILKALEPSSTIGDITTTITSPSVKNDPTSLHSDDVPLMTSPLNAGTVETTLHRRNRSDHRHSIISQTASGVIDSSTLEFAVRYSIPMAAGAGFPDTTSDPTSELSVAASSAKSTEDGMSELLAGYQHTESKHEGEAMSQDVMAPRESGKNEHGAKKCGHVPKSSDEQSFKSCTDLPEVVSEPATPPPNHRRVARSFKSSVDVKAPSVKDSDAHSFSTAKVAVTPDQAASVPPSRLPSSGLVTSAPLFNRQAPEAPLGSSPPAVVRKPTTSSVRESSFSAMTSRLRLNSKSSVKHSSVSVSISGSSSTLSNTQQPPVVPPRASSSSKEAQRYQAVTSFLMRAVPSRRSKNSKRIEDADGSEASPKKPVLQTSSQSEQAPQDASSSSFELPLDIIKTLEKAVIRGHATAASERRASVSESARNPSQSSNVLPTVIEQQPATSNPFPAYVEPSSVYSPQDSSFQSRPSSSPAGVSSPENGRRESQTTTHLVWPGRRSLNKHSASTSEPHLPLPDIQENTTTDLRLSGYGYKYPGPAQHLPDLKEESHEDSSLHTSASNLKNSNFRFPSGGPQVMRVSVDDSLMAPQRVSTGSHQRGAVSSALGKTRGLPSMHFSQMDLFEKLNEELGLRISRSLEDVKSPEKDDDSPRRPASASEVRKKFRSLVAGLEKLESNSGSAQLTDEVGLGAPKRARSPEQIIAEIEGLTIPSVGGLTERISKLLPSLREYYGQTDEEEFPDEEVIIEKAMQKLAEVAPTQKRSNARLRPVPGSPNMLVVDDAVFDEIISKDQEGASPSGGGDGQVEGSCAVARPGAKQRGENGSHSQTRQSTHHVDVERPSPARLRHRSHTFGPEAFRASGDSILSSRRSLRSVVSTPTVSHSRPWNTDKNWPWESSPLPPLEISLPPQAAVRDSLRSGPSHLRNSLSGAISTSSFSSGQTATASPFGSGGNSNTHARQHRFSVFGRSGDQPHAVGERYPTSALTPPTAIFRDHFTPSDTSDDEDFDPSRKSRLGIRKRFSSARSAKADQTAQVTRCKTTPLELTSPESHEPVSTSILHDNAGESEAFTSHRHTFRDAEGMRGSEYHRQRIIDRLKRWWHKGGNLIRTISGRRQRGSTNV
ncbi:hypothetical protein NX059_003147 [Plenodomus lindquistii]|nr:hypothetical protein NX059_003147 [Plenodomus lindquistii]